MVGQTKTKAIYYTNSGDNRKRHEAKETKDFLSYKIKIGDFDGKAASGVHSFPFSLTLPEGLAPSMKVGCETFRGRKLYVSAFDDSFYDARGIRTLLIDPLDRLVWASLVVCRRAVLERVIGPSSTASTRTSTVLGFSTST